MKWMTALKLGRVSNLPTVWTNVLTGAVLANPGFDCLTVLLCATAISFFYIAGMFLNDVFDLEWDRRHQAKRPLVQGEATANEVVGISIALLAAGVALLLFASWGNKTVPVVLSAAVLIGLIVLYDWKHKQWAVVSPWIMGGCRLMVYLTAAAAVDDWNGRVLVAGLCMLAYIAGITYAARAEHLNTLYNYWPVALLFFPAGFALVLGFSDIWSWILIAAVLLWLFRAIRRLVLPGRQRQVPRAIGALLAGIALIDTAILLSLQQYAPAFIAAAAFGLCLIAQRKIAAT
jgi:4-hydroxybenzoate polyprenyltransferase